MTRPPRLKPVLSMPVCRATSLLTSAPILSRGWYRPPKSNRKRNAAPEVKAVLNARCRYLVSRVTAHYHACHMPETRPPSTPIIVSRLRLLSSITPAIALPMPRALKGIGRTGSSKRRLWVALKDKRWVGRLPVHPSAAGDCEHPKRPPPN